MNATKSAEIFRHYDHFMQQQSDLSTCMELLERVHGDAYREAFNEYEDITDFEARNGHDLSLFRRIGEQLSGLSEQVMVFHYQSILHSLDTAAGGAIKRLHGASNYPIAILIVVGVLLAINEFRVQPTLISLYANFGAAPPEGWYFFRVVGFILLPVSYVSIGLLVWVIRSASDPRKFMSLVVRVGGTPGLSALSQAYRGFLITKVLRFAVAQGVETGQSIDVVRQALVLLDDTRPAAANKLNIEVVIASLDAANRMDIFERELDFWEQFSADQMRAEVLRLGSLVEPVAMSLLGLLVGAMVIQMYLWIFNIGDIF